jgi:putative ABC transport system permease protein
LLAEPPAKITISHNRAHRTGNLRRNRIDENPAITDHFGEGQNGPLLVTADLPGGPDEAQKARIESGLEGFADTRVQTRQEWIDKEDEEISQFLLLLYVLLALSVIISLFGMVNTLVLSVYERTRELGMLRTIGMTRRQARRMIRHESVITALIGAALGLPLGISLAALVTQALSEYDVGMSLPAGELVAFTVVAVLAGVAAAILPARRASRLDVLDALHYE